MTHTADEMLLKGWSLQPLVDLTLNTPLLTALIPSEILDIIQSVEVSYSRLLYNQKLQTRCFPIKDKLTIFLFHQDPRLGYFYGVNLHNTNYKLNSIYVFETFFLQQSGSVNVPNKTIENGENGLDQLGIIKLFEGEPQLHYWDDTYCDMINGRI